MMVDVLLFVMAFLVAITMGIVIMLLYRLYDELKAVSIAVHSWIAYQAEKEDKLSSDREVWKGRKKVG